MSPVLQLEERSQAIGRGVRQAAEHLLRLQQDEGYWCALLTADTTLESDFVLMELWLDPPSRTDMRWSPARRPMVERAVESILSRQLADGGFNIYVDGPSEISASVKAYFALKIAGVDAASDAMLRLRERIIDLGGIQAANSYVKLNLSLFGCFPREFSPSVPPELMLGGKLIYEMSSWTRAIVIALSIVHAADPNSPVPMGFNLDELWKPGATARLLRDHSPFSARNLFFAIDRACKIWEKVGIKAIRNLAIRRAEAWMVERLSDSEGLAAIYPAMQYSIMALDVLGYAKDHPLRVEALRQFERLRVDDGRAGAQGETFFHQPCFSPVWDTAIAGYALGEAGWAGSAELERAADWFLDREIRRTGDWAVKRPGVEPSGWAFEFRNDHYPDIDDTAMVLLALTHARAGQPSAQRATVKRAVDWLVAMQSKDGGWAAFDADNNWDFLNHVPFADHNAMLDETCADITGRVMEGLCAHGLDRNHPSIRRGIDFLIRTQEADGSWYGRWGVAYIYGTCFALRGLAAAGEDDREVHMLRATEWLRAVQNADGGWGERCESYDRAGYVGAESTPSQTAWAVLGLLAGGDTSSESVRRGVDYLLATQNADGSWDERPATGTGFPRVFYLNYHYYRLYFPLLALANCAKLQQASHLDRL